MTEKLESLLTKEGKQYLEQFTRELRKDITVQAIIYALGNKDTEVLPSHIKKAGERLYGIIGKRDAEEKVKTTRWLLRFGLGILASLTILQINVIRTLNETIITIGDRIALWLLPVVLILWLIVFSYHFRSLIVK